MLLFYYRTHQGTGHLPHSISVRVTTLKAQGEHRPLKLLCHLYTLESQRSNLSEFLVWRFCPEEMEPNHLFDLSGNIFVKAFIGAWKVYQLAARSGIEAPIHAN